MPTPSGCCRRPELSVKVSLLEKSDTANRRTSEGRCAPVPVQKYGPQRHVHRAGGDHRGKAGHQLLEQGRRGRLDGRHAARPSDLVRPGSIVALPLHGRVRILRVLALPSRRGPAAEARSCYEEIDEGGGAT